MQGITVRFGDLIANDRVDLVVERGEVRALLGENGAGKTTLMKALVGLVQPQTGRIELHGHPVDIRSPVDAMALGIGMVHQHFMLIPPLTVAQNVCIGLRSAGYPFPDLRRVATEIRSLASRYGLQVEPDQRVAQLSVGAQQRVEILKALYRGAELLILDEPTSVLTPQETEGLFAVIRSLVEQGKAVIFISHKLNEVMTISQHVTVLRKGQVVATRRTAATDPAELAELMVGRAVDLPHLEEPAAIEIPPLLRVRGLFYRDERKLEILRGIDLEVRPGEIHGLAGVDGNGQEELAGILAGILPATAGRIVLDEQEVTYASPAQRIEAGLAHIPGDRQHTALVMDMPVVDNCLLELSGQAPYARSGFLQFAAIRTLAQDLIATYDIRCQDQRQPVATLSGGNQQKLVLARELFRKPRFVIAVQPTRGLDVGATAFVYSMLLAQRAQGCAILLVSTELDEIMALSDRVSVIYEGRIMGTQVRAQADRSALGLMMAGKQA
jgi:simple sugar transport system ATP-binding protein